MILLRLLSRLPLGVLYLFADALYLVTYHVWGFRKGLTLQNLRNSFPEKSDMELESIARRSYRNACELIVEVLKGAVISRDELRLRMRIQGLQSLVEFTATGRPVVLLASHYGNWEWLLLAICAELRGGVDAVYKPLRMAAIDRFMVETRSRFGGNPIPVKNFMIEVMKRRGGARVFALVADQTPPRDAEKHWTRFLNQDTAFFVGADRIARITRAPVFFVGMKRVSRGHYKARLDLLSEPPHGNGDRSAIIEGYARAAEALVRRHPADWLWMYRKWKYKKPVYD